MEEKTINPNESFAIISQMIDTAKNRLADDGFLFIFWGWLVLAAALGNYVSVLLGSEIGYYVWPVLMPLGGIVSLVYSRRQERKERIKTYVSGYMSHLWLAFFVALAITLVFMPYHGMRVSYFFMMLLYGIACFVTGGLLDFKPLVYGGAFSFAVAVVSVFCGHKEQYLCIAAALLFSYIIPGHLLRARFRSQKNV